MNSFSEEVYLCKTCNMEKPFGAFSAHKQCVLGIDTSRCKECKKSFSKAANEWATKSIEDKILNRVKTRAKEKGLAFNLELEDIVIPDVCPVFKVPFIYGDHSWTYSLDRIKPELGYVKGNVVIISNKANMMKNTATAEDVRMLYQWMLTLEEF